MVEVDTGEGDYHIEIIEGPFIGVQYKYTTIQFIGEDSEGNGVFNYDYELITDPKIITEEDLPEFEHTLGDILHIILSAVADGKELPE